MEVSLRVSDEDPADETKMNSVKEASVSLDNVRMQHAIMLKQKSRNKWLIEGASNTAFFHANIQTRMSSNVISELVDENGNTITDYAQIRDYTVQFFEAKFKGVEQPIDDSFFHYDHESISMEEGVMMDAVPSLEEIKIVVFDLGVDSAPGPNGFSGCFYRHCWYVITYCWQNKLIPQGYNSSLLILLAKEEQVAFMKGRNIRENVSVASEMVNEFKSKRKHGNVGLKLDISQAFDTVRWSFVLEVFRKYGFLENWCSWILTILSSAHISVLLNGSPEGFFSINRGLLQGDPLSLIFLLIKDFLNRNLTKLFLSKSMTPMLSKNGISPTHLFFTDDIMIFCKGNMKSLHSLLDLLGKYQTSSGKTVCRQKSKVYYGGSSLSRCRTITDLLGMEVSTFPDRYLGVQIMPGAVKYRHICNVIDKIKNQLSVWKGKFLSFQNRVVLINSVIASYSIHNMVVCKWPRKFIDQCERVIRNFLWSGDAEVCRKVVVAYDKVCFRVREGGLGITKLVVTNKALLMKLWWNIKTSTKKWALFLYAKYTNRMDRIKEYGVNSSILPGIKQVYREVEENTKVLIGDGRSTSLYFDIWYGYSSIADIIGEEGLDSTIKVCSLLINNEWVIPDVHMHNMLCVGVNIADLPSPLGGDDCRVWMPDLKGIFSVSSAKHLIPKKYAQDDIYALLWRKVVHPNLAAQNWKLEHGACATLDKIQSRFKISLVNKCYMCRSEEESIEHILWTCDFSTRVWGWISGIFNLTPHFNLIVSYKVAKGRRRIIKDLWLIANLIVRAEMWLTRNKIVYDKKTANSNLFKQRVFYLVHEHSVRIKSFMHNTPPPRNCLLLYCDGAAKDNPGRAGDGVVVKDADCNVDGAMSIGLRITNNFMAELCAILVGLEWAIRQRWIQVQNSYDSISFDHTYRETNFSADDMAKRGCLLTNGEESGALGVSKKFVAEVLGTINALEWAVSEHKNKVTINSDSKAAITAFTKNKIPWFIWSRWRYVCSKLNPIHFNHVFREVNFSADFFAKKGVHLAKGQKLKFTERPLSMHRMEFPDIIYSTTDFSDGLDGLTIYIIERWAE
ncbi:uncharacterized protein LOC113356176 [Papaver somniferum]|uniref:uncharacterized protein LOC113356176 n=1 Tax=Papaver somniferum TaxID=3469 RepID=UPI000E6FCCC8|nr:uncharacterized protein LOC113356176 [Papaver somniferum]